MADNTTEIEIFVMVDQDGDYVLAKDADDLGSKYEDELSSSPPNNVRVFALKLTVPLPKVVEVAGTLPDTDGPVTLTISG